MRPNSSAHLNGGLLDKMIRQMQRPSDCFISSLAKRVVRTKGKSETRKGPNTRSRMEKIREKRKEENRDLASVCPLSEVTMFIKVY